MRAEIMSGARYFSPDARWDIFIKTWPKYKYQQKFDFLDFV